MSCHIEIRWLEKVRPFVPVLQFRVIEEGEIGYRHYGEWENVPTEVE